MQTFTIDCPECRCRVAAEKSGNASVSGLCDETDEPYCEEIIVGNCPACRTLLVGYRRQIGFEGFYDEEDEWSTVDRVYPKPAKAFSSHRIPHTLTESLKEGDRCMQAGAETAACVMFGRALEALCRDVLDSNNEGNDEPKKSMMLAEGLKKLRACMESLIMPVCGA